jgi:hypothetical protein
MSLKYYYSLLKYIAIITILVLLIYYKYITFSSFNFIITLFFNFIVTPILVVYDVIYMIVIGVLQFFINLKDFLFQLYKSFMTYFGILFSFINYISLLLLYPDELL